MRFKAVYVFTNLGIQKGGCKSPVWDPSFKILPSGLARLQGALLQPHAARETNWYEVVGLLALA
eukprot:11196401-Lingulodinium_polyedra.AAC.1